MSLTTLGRRRLPHNIRQHTLQLSISFDVVCNRCAQSTRRYAASYLEARTAWRVIAIKLGNCDPFPAASESSETTRLTFRGDKVHRFSRKGQPILARVWFEG